MPSETPFSGGEEQGIWTVEDPWQRASSQCELLVWYCWPASMVRKALLTADAHSYGQKDRVAEIANGKTHQISVQHLG